MSKAKIEAALKKKGITPEELYFERSEPTPSGYAHGWTIEFSEETVSALYLVGYEDRLDPDASNSKEMLEWVSGLPDLTGWPKPGQTFPVRMIDNWDGEGDQITTLAIIDSQGDLTDVETGKGLLEYEGDQLLEWWPPLTSEYGRKTQHN
jgi:hypothetical protein